MQRKLILVTKTLAEGFFFVNYDVEMVLPNTLRCKTVNHPLPNFMKWGATVRDAECAAVYGICCITTNNVEKNDPCKINALSRKAKWT